MGRIYLSSPDPKTWPTLCGPIPPPSEPFKDDVQFAVSFTCQEIADDFKDPCTWVGPIFNTEMHRQYEEMMEDRGDLKERGAKIRDFIRKNAVQKEGDYYLCRDKIEAWVLQHHALRDAIKKLPQDPRQRAVDFYGGERIESVRANVVAHLGAAGKLQKGISPAPPPGTTDQPEPAETDEGGDTGTDQTDWFRTPGFISAELAPFLAAGFTLVRRYLPWTGASILWFFRSGISMRFLSDILLQESVPSNPAPRLPPWPWVYRGGWNHIVRSSFRGRPWQQAIFPLRIPWRWALFCLSRAPVWIPTYGLISALAVYGLDRFWQETSEGKQGFLTSWGDGRLGNWNYEAQYKVYSVGTGIGYWVSDHLRKGDR